MALLQILRDKFGQVYQAKCCKDCEEIKPVTEFRKSGKYYNSYCKDCFKIRNRDYTRKRTHTSKIFDGKKPEYKKNKSEYNKKNKSEYDSD